MAVLPPWKTTSTPTFPLAGGRSRVAKGEGEDFRLSVLKPWLCRAVQDNTADPDSSDNSHF